MSHLRILHWLPRTLRRKSKLLHHIKTPALSGLSLLQNLILYNVLFYSFSPITSLLCQDFSWHKVFACCVPTLEYSSNKCMHLHVYTLYTRTQHICTLHMTRFCSFFMTQLQCHLVSKIFPDQLLWVFHPSLISTLVLCLFPF